MGKVVLLIAFFSYGFFHGIGSSSNIRRRPYKNSMKLNMADYPKLERNVDGSLYEDMGMRGRFNERMNLDVASQNIRYLKRNRRKRSSAERSSDSLPDYAQYDEQQVLADAESVQKAESMQGSAFPMSEVNAKSAKKRIDQRKLEFQDEDYGGDDQGGDDQGGNVESLSNSELTNEIHDLEGKVQKMEGKQGSDVVHVDLPFSLRWKKYRNLSDEDTMELKYEVVGKEKKENLTVTVILYIVTPVVALLLLAYTAVSLYWTKCWFWKVVPPDRFYKFERFELDQEEDPTDLAPLMKTPLEALQRGGSREDLQNQYASNHNLNDTESRPRSRSRSRNRRERRPPPAAYDDDFAMSAQDFEARRERAHRGRTPERENYRDRGASGKRNRR